MNADEAFARIDARLQALEAAATGVSNREAIGELVFAYAAGCDACDASAVGALFEEDAELVVANATVSGRDAITAWYRERLTEPKKHYVTNTRLSPLPDGAIGARSEFLAVHMDAGRPALLIWGSYTDRVRLRNGRATFLSRAIGIDGRGSVVGAVP